jgi:hypothetical protein
MMVRSISVPPSQIAGIRELANGLDDLAGALAASDDHYDCTA